MTKCCWLIRWLLKQNGTLKQNTNTTQNDDHDANIITVWPDSNPLWTDDWVLKPVLFKNKNWGAAGLGKWWPTLTKRNKYQDSGLQALHSHPLLFTATIILSLPDSHLLLPSPLEFKCSVTIPWTVALVSELVFDLNSLKSFQFFSRWFIVSQTYPTQSHV